eukprot:scaffold30357_cov52-Phaeocystis_antarctica.AAC.5
MLTTSHHISPPPHATTSPLASTKFPALAQSAPIAPPPTFYYNHRPAWDRSLRTRRRTLSAARGSTRFATSMSTASPSRTNPNPNPNPNPDPNPGLDHYPDH